jgi:hypothetical protein
MARSNFENWAELSNWYRCGRRLVRGPDATLHADPLICQHNLNCGGQVDGLAELLGAAEMFIALAAIGLAFRVATLLADWSLRGRSEQPGRSLSGMAGALAVGSVAAAAFTAVLSQPWPG